MCKTFKCNTTIWCLVSAGFKLMTPWSYTATFTKQYRQSSVNWAIIYITHHIVVPPDIPILRSNCHSVASTITWMRYKNTWTIFLVIYAVVSCAIPFVLMYHPLCLQTNTCRGMAFWSAEKYLNIMSLLSLPTRKRRQPIIQIPTRPKHAICTTNTCYWNPWKYYLRSDAVLCFCRCALLCSCYTSGITCHKNSTSFTLDFLLYCYMTFRDVLCHLIEQYVRNKNVYPHR